MARRTSFSSYQTCTIKIIVSLDATIEEETNKKNLNEEKLYKIEKRASELVQDQAKELVAQLQKDQSDILGIGAILRAENSNYWDQEIKTTDKWAEVYKEMDIQINVNYDIERVGMEWK